ncbi:MAG TPA: molybdopterin-dependent oxidoreductase [Spongiibacteraceae bacterium]|nr:molybdopterin-dependent oxidoreductase [Spongiibacteraceae bacterium]
MPVATKYTFCRICEATCGLEVDVDVENNRVLEIRPDKQHVVSKGYSCVKGIHFDAIQHSPDRITTPQKRVGTTWHSISWEQALSEIGARIRELIDRNGAQAMAHLVGSAGGANVLAPLYRNAFYKALGSRRLFGTGTCDTTNKFRVCEDMYGSPFQLSYPDIDRTEFVMILGGNPVVSGTTLFHLPQSVQRLKGIVKRGGRAVFINPRRIETAQAGEHFFIRPDTDVFFLAEFCNELIISGGVDSERVAKFMKGYPELEAIVAEWSAEKQAAVTGIDAATLRDLLASFRKASAATGGGAGLYMATGVNQGRSGTLCFWLLECINAISGNLDRAGGMLMGKGIVDMAGQVKKAGDVTLRYDREDGLPSVVGLQPSGMLAPDIEQGRIKGMIVEASNPLLACSNPDGRLDRAFEKLELLVCIDLFRNEVGNLAHYILPAPTWLERDEIPYALQSFMACTPVPYMTYSDAVLKEPDGVRHEWWIYSRLAEAAGVTMFGKRWLATLLKLNTRLAYSSKPWQRKLALTPKKMISGMLKQAGLPDADTFVREHTHGILMAENRGGNYLGSERVLTDDGRVDLAPQEYVATFKAKIDFLYADELANRDAFKLIGKREIKRINSASANVPRLVKDTTNYAYVNPQDAEELGIGNGEMLTVSSAFGVVEVPIKLSDEMMRRTVAIPQCWGHKNADGLRHAQQHPGINSNYLAGDGADNVEALSGMSHLSGIIVELRKTATGDQPVS